ncbi:E3 ubiquitin-protein ligase, partial [Thalictrum thalictroides]
MEIDSPSQPSLLSSQDRILQRLYQCGVPEEKLNQLQHGIVDYVKENKYMLSKVIYAILPTDANLVEAVVQAKGDNGDVVKVPSMRDQFRESMKWLQWLMFENEPRATLKNLANTSVNQRGLCGAVWGNDDIAYRCRTCENDSTCAICVPCFQNGNHKDHDYSLMYTGGGCCDCGDVTAWKREGFCSKHKGAEQIQPLAEETANCVGPVLDVILNYWKEKLLFTQTNINANPRRANRSVECIRVSNDLTASIVEMLLEFCKFSESLLSFISKRVFSSNGLLDILVRAERFVRKNVIEKLHELLLKLLGEPSFKLEFAKVYIKYYPDTIKEAIKESSDSIFEKYPLLFTFSVQIFTVPTLTPCLVKEMNLLGMLLRCLTDIFYFCLDNKEGHIEVGKWASLFVTTIHLIEDIRYVMSHAEVPKYVTHEQPDISRTWINLLAYVQGMNPQKRVTGLLVEEENEHMSLPFRLGHSIAKIHSRLVSGAFSGELEDNIEDNDGLCHAKVGWLSRESFVCSRTGRNNESDLELKAGAVNFEPGNHLPVPSSVMWLICECLRATENWLRFNCVTTDEQNFFSQDTCRNGRNFLDLKKTLPRISKGKSILKAYRAPLPKSQLHLSSELNGKFGPLSSMCIDLKSEQSRNTNDMDTTDMDVEYSNASRISDESILDTACGMESETFGVLNLSDWPDISYDVSSQGISSHIPLHRLLAMLLQNTLGMIYSGSKEVDVDAINSVSNLPPPGCSVDFFGRILGGCHPFGFSAFLMEHPLRIRVFCGQVRAGMWRKNGEAVMLSWEYYRTVSWSEQCLELDLFLLQCCAALAPPDRYVERILERFGLSNYLSLCLERSNEYEPILAQDMLNLIIQIVKDRRFCGNSTADNLRGELICRLAIGDATHSELVKALPHDLSKSSHLQDILDTVAVYANPSEMKQGKYSLREACWEDLDLYHPRWNSRDLQVAEERYLRFRKVSASTVQLPRWTNVFNPLYGISRIATCRTVLNIVRAVLFYAVFTDKPSSSRAPDGVPITALHLLSLALDICHWQRNSSGSGSMGMEDSLPVIDFACEEVDIQATSKSESDGCKPQSLLSLLVSLAVKHRIDSVNNFSEAAQSDFSSMIETLLKRFAELDAGCMTKLKTLAPQVVCHLLPPITNSDIHMSGTTSNLQDRKAKGRERQAAIL